MANKEIFMNTPVLVEYKAYAGSSYEGPAHHQVIVYEAVTEITSRGKHHTYAKIIELLQVKKNPAALRALKAIIDAKYSNQVAELDLRPAQANLI